MTHPKHTFKVIGTKTIPLDDIRIDGGTQSRKEINTGWVDTIHEKMISGTEFRPVTTFFDGKTYWLADGFHRYHATSKLGKSMMACEVINGTLRDAILYSKSANANHGLQMLMEDKRANVIELLNDFEWGMWSDREIASHCDVSHVYVGKLRNEQSTGTKQEERKYRTKTGKVATRKIKPKQPKAEPEEPKIDPKIVEMQEHIEALMESNDHLTKQLAKEVAPDPKFAEQTIDELREENKQLRIEVKSLTISRDSYQAENAQLIKQVKYLQKKLKDVSQK